jgi:hypothetical protein
MTKWIHSQCQECHKTESVTADEARYDGCTLTGNCCYCEAELCYECNLLHECNGHKPEGYYCQGCGEVYEWHEKKYQMIDGDAYCQDCVDKYEAKGELNENTN